MQPRTRLNAELDLRTLMKSASNGSQSMARAALRFGPNGVSLSFCRQFAITSSCQRRASVATHLTIAGDPETGLRCCVRPPWPHRFRRS